MKRMTRAQMEALRRVFLRDGDNNTIRSPNLTFRRKRSYLAFRRTARLDALMGCVMVPWAGMWLGIEEDGYTHS